MNEQETTPVTSTEVASTPEATSSAATADVAVAKKGGKTKAYVVAVILVLAILLGALYLMEKEGRSETNVFGWLIESQQSAAVVATVNGTDITGDELATSIEQFTQVAATQGVDVTSPDVQADIRTQALDVLVNTELLKQAAADAGVVVSTEDAEARLAEITADIGGEEVLAERMESLGVTKEGLLEDIREEMAIEEYLQQLFAAEDISASDEEVQAFYDAAGGTEAGLPELEVVRGQIEQQITAGQEQAVIDAELTDLRAEAEIEVVE